MKLVQLLVFRDNTVSVSFLQRNLKRYTKNAKNNDIQEEMKKSKAVYVTKRKIRDDQNLVYHLYRSERERRGRSTHRTNFGSQYDSRRDSKICTCKKSGKMYHNEYYYSGLPKQIYACHGSRRYIDIGVGSIKTIQRKKVKRIYLPETDDTGVGSSDLSSFMFRRKYPKIINVSSYYGHKKTSSKCIGGIIEYNTGCVVNQKLSPIIQTKSDATSPKRSLIWKRNIETGSNTIDNRMETTETQFEIQEIEKQGTKTEELESIVAISHIEQQKQSTVTTKPPTKVSVQTQKKKFSDENVETKKKVEPENKTKEVRNTERTYSSDSLVQHVHNLENPSDEKQSRISFPDTMENKLEREYRKMFLTTKSKQSCDKPIPEFKSASILRRRFEALKRGIIRKDDSNTKKKGSSLMKAVVKTSNTEVPTHKDASVTSDPPSLISVSFSDTEQYKQAQQETKTEKNKTMPQKKDKQGIRLSTESQPNSVNSEGQNVKGMFRLWGKKFNFEEDAYGKRQATPMPSYDKTKKKDTDKEEELKGEAREKENKKEGKKFFFFKKKSKDTPENTAYSPKKDVTAGRCEIRDGIVLKIGEAGTSKAKKSKSKNPDEGNEIIRKAWMKKFMSETMESARSVNIRWNNSLYATSSSTVFALLDSVYKNTDVILSKRDVTDESSYFKSFTKQVNFVRDIEAWMIPRTIIDRPIKQMPMRQMPLKTIPLCINSEKGVNKKNVDSTPSDQKWYIEKSEAFSHKIEVVLHSNKTTDISNKKTSSEYLRIDIPGDFFDTSSDESKQNHSSDEEVFKIVEYETNSEITKATNELHKCDNVSTDIKLIVSVKDSRSMESKILETVLKRPPINKSSIVQGNDENESQRCDVIGVGIITQRDLREMRKPVLKIRDGITGRDDLEPFRKLKQKKCEFAESYLKEYYRHIPFGMDLCPWCVSDSHICSSSEKSCTSGYQAKSCPNIYEDLKVTIVTSCDTSSVPCKAYNYDELKKETTYNKIFKRFMRPSKAKTESELAKNQRSLPKDSIEVFKKRKINEMTARAEWARIANDVKDVTCSVPSVQSKCCSSTKINVPLLRGSGVLDTSATDHGEEPIKKMINFKPSECESCTSENKCAKHAVLNPFLCEITQQPSRDVVFEIMATSSCNKPKTHSNDLMSSKTILGYNSSVNYQSPIDSLPAPLCVQACCEPSSEMPHPNKNPRSKSPSPTESPSNIETPCQRPTCKIPKLCRKLCTVSSPREHSPPTCSPCRTPPTSASALYGPPLSHKNVHVKKSVPSKKCTGSCCKQQPSQSSNVPSCSKCSPISSILNGKKLKSPSSQLPPSEPAPDKICQKESPRCKTPNKSLNEENSLHGQKSILKRTPSENCCEQRSASPKSLGRNSPKFNQSCAEPASDNRKVCCKSSSSLNQLEKPHTSPKVRSPECSQIPYFPRDSPKRPQSPRCASPQILPEKPILRNGSPKVQSPCSSCCSSKSSASSGLPKNSMSPLPSGISLKKAGAPVSPKPPTPPTPPKPKRKIYCDTPPCDTLRKLEDVEVFPWPTKNQVSNPPSPCPSLEPKKSGDKCKKDCSMKQLKSERPLPKNISPNPSNNSCFPDPTCFPVLPDGDNTVSVLKLASVPRCSPYKVVSTPCPPKQDNMIACVAPQQANSTPCPPKSQNMPECSAPDCSILNSPNNEVPKMSGLHLKKKGTGPVKKTCADDCPAWNEPMPVTMKDTPCTDTFNSVKQETASDREVRGPMNIKVQDEDGVTLYERRDYDCMHSQDSADSRNTVIEDLYKEPEINRIGTPLTVRNMEEDEDEDKKDLSSQISDKSLLNSVEIDFKLRITQGDKTTEIDIGNDDDKRALRADLNQSRPEVFMINNGKTDPTIEIPKNDINIKITLRNFKSKPKCKNGKDKKRTADFSKQISDKFHTVSTGYSDVEEENTFSVHRATINLASSPIVSHESSNLHGPVPACDVSSHTLDMVSDVTEDYKLDKMLSDKEDQVEKYIDLKESITPNYEEINDNLCAIEYSEPTLNETDTEKVTLNDTNRIEKNDDKIMSKVASKEQKKGLLKKVFQKAGSRTKNKENIRELRDMLKIILTDSSDNEENNISGNELAKDVTYTSLKPNYFRNTDSMNNYYEIDSNISSIRDSKQDSLYPTAEINSRTSRSSDTEDNEVAFKGCMCSAIAEKLNQLNGGQIGCCCRQNLSKDEETNCDIRNADDYFLLNYKTAEFVDVETQNSRRLTGTVNSYNVSIHSRSNRFSTTSENVKVIEDLKTPNNRELSIAQCESVAYESIIESEHIKVEHIAIVSHIGKLSKHNCNNCIARSSEIKQLYQSSADTNDNLSVQIPPIDKNKKSFKRNRRNEKSEEAIDGIDVLQSYAAKKAVLEIYAEKAENGDKFVAKLPKFVVERESEMTKNFEELASNPYKSMENVIVMSVER